MTIPRPRLAQASALAVLGLGWLGGCSDNPGGPDPDPQPQGIIVSDPVPTTLVTGAGAALIQARSAGAGDSVSYVSLPPGTIPTGKTAIIRRVGDAGVIFTTVVGGGFDPVPVAAQADDFIDIRVTNAGGDTLLALRVAALRTRPPIVVRTYPPRRKTDVSLNAAIIIVFSEPVAGGTLTPPAVQLFRGTTAVPGTVRLLEGSGTVAAFVPAAPLASNTQHRLVVTQAVRDLDGDALDARLTTEFTTGQSLTGPPDSITLAPDTVRLSGATYQMTVTVYDAAGNELIDQPVTWATSDPNGLAVSPTGLLTALQAGSFSVTATVNGLTAFAQVVVSAGPAASVELSPPQATVGAAGDTIILTAIVRDAVGRLLSFPSVTWTSSALAVATATPLSAGSFGVALGLVTGVSPGSATITATSGSASAAASVTVIPPQPVVSITVTPPSATLAVRTTKQLSATLQDATGKVLAGRPVTWTTDNPTVATVDANGLVTGVSEGPAGVIATREGLSDTAAITVMAVRFASVVAGRSHTCGLVTDGSAFCWGNNGFAQLGDGSTSDRLVPVAVTGGLRFIALTAGWDHNCGLTASGTAHCWGFSGLGQLGDGGFGDGLTPVAVAGGHTFQALEAGGYHTCGVTTAGAVYCWGTNYAGQLGDGTITPSPVPVRVVTPGVLAFASVSAGGSHTCAVTTTGAAYCWGANRTGKLGNGSTEQSVVPVAVSGGLTFAAVSASDNHTCAVTTGGAAYCWGSNFTGQLGTGSIIDSSVPVAVTGGLTFSAVTAGGFHTCGVTTTGTAFCWGNNLFGQLGDGSTTDRSVPGAVSGGLALAGLSTGEDHSCGVTIGSVAYCWGRNESGQLGTGTTIDSNVPVKVEGQP